MLHIPKFDLGRGELLFRVETRACSWSGAEHRLARELQGRFGTNAYAIEELVAELGSACQPLQDHVAYIESWLRVVSSDARAILMAADKAQEAADFLNGLAVPAREQITTFSEQHVA